jgi:hypothetical protein
MRQSVHEAFGPAAGADPAARVLTFDEAACRAGVGSERIAELVRSGALRTVPVGDVLLLPAVELERVVRGRVIAGA